MGWLILFSVMIAFYVIDFLSALENYKKDKNNFKNYEQNKNLVYYLENNHGFLFFISELFLVLLISGFVSTSYVLITGGSFIDGFKVGFLTQIFINVLGMGSNLYVRYKLWRASR